MLIAGLQGVRACNLGDGGTGKGGVRRTAPGGDGPEVSGIAHVERGEAAGGGAAANVGLLFQSLGHAEGGDVEAFAGREEVLVFAIEAGAGFQQQRGGERFVVVERGAVARDEYGAAIGFGGGVPDTSEFPVEVVPGVAAGDAARGGNVPIALGGNRVAVDGSGALQKEVLRPGVERAGQVGFGVIL